MGRTSRKMFGINLTMKNSWKLEMFKPEELMQEKYGMLPPTAFVSFREELKKEIKDNKIF